MPFMNIAPGHAEEIPASSNRVRQFHCFDADSISAIDAALAAQRLLLLRGEPGIGKRQFPRAAALVPRRAYVQQVVDACTESSASPASGTTQPSERSDRAEREGAQGSAGGQEDHPGFRAQ